MNQFPTDRRAEILHHLTEGVGVNATARLTHSSPTTVDRLLASGGRAAFEFHNQKMRGLPLTRVEIDEIWCFNYCKRDTLPNAKAAPEGAGDVWLFTALDAETKLLITWLACPDRGIAHTLPFLQDLRARTTGERFQLSSDGLHSFAHGAHLAFGNTVDYGQMIKPPDIGRKHKPEKDGDTLFLLPKGNRIEKRQTIGNPNPTYTTTAHLESFNQTIRASLRRYARRTNAHSKKLENHNRNIALFATYYNWIRPHTSLGSFTTPAMAAGLAARPYEMSELIDLIDAIAPAPKPRGPYRKHTRPNRRKNPARPPSQQQISPETL